ncbi:MAG: hypothetical protein RBT63_02380 [Bdellovibrionales bacterium]|jgi:hypothetical protein|nr:hypothetical protein [Bdellovibrionales bacterium]
MKHTARVLSVLSILVSLASVTAASAYSPSESQSAEISSSLFPTPREVYQEGLDPYVFVTAGLMNPEGSYNTGGEYGFGFGFQPYIPFGLGMEMLASRNQSKHHGTRDLERTTVLVRATYNFGGSTPILKDSYVGLATGPTINQDATYFALAPVVGFDIPVREWSGEYLSSVTVGLDAKYMMVSSDDANGLSVNGALKYWF